MNSHSSLLKKFISKTQSWSDYYEFLNLSEEELEDFFKLARELTIQNFRNIIKAYIPNKKFPALSITGNECALNCEHCNKKYLKGMKHIQNSKALKDFLLTHYKGGGVGALISGGCDSNGSVPLFDFIGSIKEIKEKTSLIINVHTGLLNETTARALAEAKVDIISFDITMDEKVIREIYHLDKNLDDYRNSIELLKKYKLNIVPHICVGLYYGKLNKELDSLKFIKESGIKPSLIVVIALIPPKVIESNFKEPKPSEIAKFIAAVRFLFPKAEISLGCMRPKGGKKIEIEKYALNAGITRIEIPSKKTLKWLRKMNPEIEIKFFSSCCAIPREFEDLAKAKESDLKIYNIK